jgi:putative transposase
MARPLRPQVENGIYHVFNRGNARQRIFEDDGDRAQFLAIFKRIKRLCGWSCLSYCLLVNHYHLVLLTRRANLARGMAQLNSGYAQAFNRRHDRVGHLFQGRYGSRLVQDDDHLLATLRYVALNPVESSLCAHPDHWPWGGHAEIAGVVRAATVDVEEVLARISSGRGEPRLTYRSMFEHSLEPALPEARGGVVVGDVAFARAAVATARTTTETPQRQRLAARPALTELFSQDRTAGLVAAYFDHGYSQREIAEHLGCHYSSVSRWLRDAETAVGMWQRKT